LVNQIQFMGGMTSFSEPLNEAIRLSKQNEDKFTSVDMYFMSDGAAPYPEAEIQAMKNHSFFKKVNF